MIFALPLDRATRPRALSLGIWHLGSETFALVTPAPLSALGGLRSGVGMVPAPICRQGGSVEGLTAPVEAVYWRVSWFVETEQFS